MSDGSDLFSDKDDKIQLQKAQQSEIQVDLQIEQADPLSQPELEIADSPAVKEQQQIAQLTRDNKIRDIMISKRF